MAACNTNKKGHRAACNTNKKGHRAACNTNKKGHRAACNTSTPTRKDTGQRATPTRKDTGQRATPQHQQERTHGSVQHLKTAFRTSYRARISETQARGKKGKKGEKHRKKKTIIFTLKYLRSVTFFVMSLGNCERLNRDTAAPCASRSTNSMSFWFAART
jgi:hypothetical protein